MGTLRTLFAIAVVLAHTYGNVLVGGRNAVQLFYMISGFLISFVIIEKKAYASIWSFYANRFLRVYPIYLVVAFLTLVTYAIFEYVIGERQVFFDTYRSAPAAADALLVLSNAVLFFQDWVMFTGVSHGDLVFSKNFANSEVLLYKGLLIPQAWTLGVELSFYALAPFLLDKVRWLLAMLLLSVGVRLSLFSMGLGMADPWSYRFFPSELAFFLLGALAHQWLLPWYRSVLPARRLNAWAAASTGLLVFITLVYGLVPGSGNVKSALLFAIFLPLLPMAFVFQAGRAWDQWVGDLSYPIYIGHMLMLFLADAVFKILGLSDKIFISAVVVICSVLFALFLNAVVGHPVELLRNRLRAAQ